MAINLVNKLYDEEFTYTKGDAWGTYRNEQLINTPSREACMRLVLVGEDNLRPQYYGSNCVYVVDIYKGVNSGGLTIYATNITDDNLRAKFVQLFGNAITIYVNPFTRSTYVVDSGGAYGGNNVCFCDTITFNVSSNRTDKFMYISPRAYHILNTGNNNIVPERVSVRNLYNYQFHDNVFSFAKAGGYLSKVPNSYEIDYNPQNINATIFINFLEPILQLNETQLDELNYYSASKASSIITYTMIVDGQSSFIKGNFNISRKIDFEQGIENNWQINYYVEKWWMDVLHKIPVPSGIKEGTQLIYKFWLVAFDKSKENMNTPIGSEMLLELWDNGDYSKVYNFHSMPLYYIVKNSSLYNDYIENENKGNIYYCIFMQSYKREWTSEVHNILDVLTRWVEQTYTDTLLGTTYSAYYNLDNSIMFDIGIPLSNTDTDDHISEHTISGVKEVLNLTYIPIVPEEDEPLGEPINQDPTPTDPAYNTNPTVIVNIYNKQEYPDLPIGTAIESMSKQDIIPTINPLLKVGALYTIYNVSLGTIPQIAHFLLNTPWYENLYQINNNPLEHILSFKASIFELPEESTEQIYLVNVPMEYGTTKIYGDVVEDNAIYDIGTFKILPKYNNFLDLTYTDYQMYLPFVGYVDLDPNLVLNYDVNLKVYVDALTLLAKYQLIRVADNLILGEWEFNSGYDIPLSASNKAQYEVAQLSNLANTVVDVLKGDIIGGIFNGLTSMASTMHHVSTSGSPSSNLSMLTSRKAYIKITRPMWQDIQNFNHTYGRLLNANRLLGSMQGFTKIAKNNDLSGIICNSEELDLIRNLLESGVYL